jgi:predicted ATPase
LIGSYRKDERPTLLAELPGAQELCLQRFSRNELALLSTSMLGNAGNQPQVVSLLERETAGNAFFLVEVVRALAEELGGLGKVGSGRIPSKIATGGVQAVLARRLGRVPTEAIPLLCAAAVLGQELDLCCARCPRS